MPAGLLVTVPLPVPVLDTVNAYAFSAKLAVTDLAASIVTMQAPVPEQPLPLQPVKVEPVAAEALSVTTVLVAYASEQPEPQSMPTGSLVTVPLPVPALETVNK